MRPLRPRAAGPALAALAALVACHAPAESPAAAEATAPAETSAAAGALDARGGEAPPVRDRGAPRIEVPADWETASPARFEREVLAGRPAPSEAEYARLAEALGDLSNLERATRAAVILGRTGEPRAERLLLDRLGRRHVHSARPDDAPDVAAAAALAPGAAREPRGEVGQALVALAVGDDPHPDLEVRVECAVSALAAGRDEVVPFLLRVLTAGTPAEREDPPDWPPQRTLAWVKSRAALALSRRAGTDLRFRADGSFADQIAEARRLAGLLGRGRGR